MLVGVDDGALLPAEAEVAHAQPQHQRQAQPHVVRHEHQHEDVGDGRLDHVQERLHRVRRRPHRVPAQERPITIAHLINYRAEKEVFTDLIFKTLTDRIILSRIN